MAARKKKAEEKGEKTTQIVIDAPNFTENTFVIRGTTQLVHNKMSNKVEQQLIEDQKAGDTGKASRKKEPKDFDALGWEAAHKSTEGWYGIPCPAIRNAMISACRTVGAVMTRSKLAFWVLPDGTDEKGNPLVKITKGEPAIQISPVRLPNGSVDMRPRPHFPPGWEAVVRIQVDEDMLTPSHIANLLMRAGIQVGILEGRHDSKKSNGQGWGCFEIAKQSGVKQVKM